MNATVKAEEDYDLYYFVTTGLLIDAMRVFKDRITPEADPAERRAAARAGIETKNKLTLLKAQHLAHKAIKNTIKPPPKDAVENAIELSAKFAREEFETAKVVDVLKAVNGVADALVKYHLDSQKA